MTTTYQQAYELLKRQLYAAYRYDHEIMMVEADQLAIVLGLAPPNSAEMDTDTAELDEITLLAIARRDAAEDDTQEMLPAIYDDIEVD